jgi:hypothetical protein
MFKRKLKKSLIGGWSFIVLIWIIPVCLFCQDEYCSTIEDEMRPDIFDEAGHYIQNRSFNSIALNINILTHDDGRKTINESLVLEEIELVNKYYEAHNIYFEICGIDFIASSDLLQFQRIDDKPVISQYNEEGKINLYIVENIIKEDGGTSCGFADYPWSTSEIIVIKKSCITNSSTLAHELGHFLGLYHTHETRFGQELVDQSNCQTSGDKLCDTPADPKLSSDNINNDCIYTGEGRDGNYEHYEPDPSLLMSYSRKQCRNKLTGEQAAIMSLSIETYYSSYLCATTSTVDQNNLSVRIYPNPTTGFVNIENPEKKDISVSIYNLQGELISAKYYQQILDLSFANPGIYIVKISDPKNHKPTFFRVAKL